MMNRAHQLGCLVILIAAGCVMRPPDSERDLPDDDTISVEVACDDPLIGDDARDTLIVLVQELQNQGKSKNDSLTGAADLCSVLLEDLAAELGETRWNNMVVLPSFCDAVPADDLATLEDEIRSLRDDDFPESVAMAFFFESCESSQDEFAAASCLACQQSVTEQLYAINANFVALESSFQIACDTCMTAIIDDVYSRTQTTDQP